MLAFELFFGRAVPERGDVSEAEWVDFVDGTVAAALPDGFTVFDARGAWFSPRAGRTIHEATKVILVALPNLPESRETVERVRSVYQTRFRQQLVGMIVQPVCGAF